MQANIMDIARVYKAMKSGNPGQVFQQVMRDNPSAQHIFQAMNSGMPIKHIVDSELKKQGKTREEVMQILSSNNLI